MMTIAILAGAILALMTYWLIRMAGIHRIDTAARHAHFFDDEEFSSHLLVRAIDHSPSAVFVLSGALHFLHCNAASHTMFGYRADEFAAIRPSALFVATKTVSPAALFSVTATQGLLPVETRMITKDGIVFPAEVTVMPFEEGGQPFFLMTVRDITERRWRDIKRDAQEREFRTLAENLPDLVVRYDRRGRFSYINPRFERMLGVRLEDVRGRRPSEISVLPEGLFFEEKVLGAIAARQNSEFEHRIEKPDGSSVWGLVSLVLEYDERGEVAYVQAVTRDIDERKKMEEDLRRSHDFLDSIIDTVADPIFVKDRHHRWIVLNEAFCRMVGLSKSELLGKSDDEIFPSEEAKIFWEGDEKVFTSGEEFSSEERFTGVWGETRTIHTRKTLFTDQHGEPVLVGVISDLTRLQSLEAKLAELSPARAS